MPHYKSVGGKLIPYEVWLASQAKEVIKEEPQKEEAKVKEKPKVAKKKKAVKKKV